MSFFQYLNVGLIYFTVGFAGAIYFFFILKRPMIGKFWGALIVGVIGSFLGGVADRVFSDIIARLSDFQSVNIIAALLCSLLMIWILAKVSSPK